MLVTERPGRLRVIRNGMLDPTPIGPMPQMLATGLGGLLDVSLHPQFAQNRLIYLTYSKPGEGQGNATTAVYRARWDGGSTLTNGQDILVANAYHGGPGTDQSVGPGQRQLRLAARLGPERPALCLARRSQHRADGAGPRSHIGKILRIRDDGSVPPDNPFVGKAGLSAGDLHARPSQSARARFPSDDERALVDGRRSAGRRRAEHDPGREELWLAARVARTQLRRHPSSAKDSRAPGLEEPVVFWVPAIAISGLSFYDGDKFPQWKGNAFVGGMRNNTGQHIQRVVFNAKGLPTGREILLAELKQRIREVKPGPDGYIYALTDETFGAILRVEPPVTRNQRSTH